MPRDDEDDRPRHKRREEEDEDRPRKSRDEDDRPRRRRRDEDDEDEDERDEDRPRRRRRDEDDEDDDDYGRSRRRLPRETLRAIAGYQKGIIFCILGYLCLIVAQFAVPDQVRIFLLIPLALLGITATVFVFLLATKVYSSGTGILYAVLTLVPLIGLFVLLAINGKATTILKKNGVHVGLLGASTSDI